MKKPITKSQLEDLRGLFIASENLGARLNDICALRKSNYKKETHRIEFTASKSGKFHSIPALEEFENYIESLSAADDADPPLFETLYHAPASGVSSVCDLIRRVFTEAGVRTANRPVTHRFFRRRAALLVGKENPLAAQSFLGHSHLSTTEIYMKRSEENANEGLAIIKKHAVVGKGSPTPNSTPDNQSA
jgi:integrase